jgi:hypothetical protein
MYKEQFLKHKYNPISATCKEGVNITVNLTDYRIVYN